MARPARGKQRGQMLDSLAGQPSVTDEACPTFQLTSYEHQNMHRYVYSVLKHIPSRDFLESAGGPIGIHSSLECTKKMTLTKEVPRSLPHVFPCLLFHGETFRCFLRVRACFCVCCVCVCVISCECFPSVPSQLCATTQEASERSQLRQHPATGNLSDLRQSQHFTCSGFLPPPPTPQISLSSNSEGEVIASR